MSRWIVKLGLILTTIGGVAIAVKWDQIAVALASVGDVISKVGVWIACHGG